MLKNIANRLLKRLAKRVAVEIFSGTEGAKQQPVLQRLIISDFKRELAVNGSPPRFSDAEFSVYSQNGEDGILLLIFSLIGFTSRRVVEVCCGDGIECNAANLIINHGFAGLLLDGGSINIATGKEFYGQATNAFRLRRLPPILVQTWITVENLNSTIRTHGFAGDIDLLSVDVDGNDYWFWDAIDCISPRVVVAEYNNRVPADIAVSVPYDQDFSTFDPGQYGEGYFGCSLLGLRNLAKSKGYRLVGANSPNTNAFFLRQDVGQVYFPEVTVAECLSSDYARHQQSAKWASLAVRNWVAV